MRKEPLLFIIVVISTPFIRCVEEVSQNKEIVNGGDLEIPERIRPGRFRCDDQERAFRVDGNSSFRAKHKMPILLLPKLCRGAFKIQVAKNLGVFDHPSPHVATL